MNRTEEKTAWDLSRKAYNIKEFNSSRVSVNGNTYYVLDRIDAGVNAVTYGTKEDYYNLENGHPEKIEHAFVAYRGSEPMDIKKRMKDYGGGKEGFDTGVGEVLYDWLGTDYQYLIQKKPFESGGTNSFKLSADYVGQHLQSQFPNATFTLTGHSLGGSEVKYAAYQYPHIVDKAYSFEGPNIYPCLPEDGQKYVRTGALNDKIFDYINLTDGLARLNRDEPSFGTQRIIYDSKAKFNMQHQDMATDINKYPLLASMNQTYTKFGGLMAFDKGLKVINPSLSYLMLATFADHSLDRYHFKSDGTLQLFSSQSWGVEDLEQMRHYLTFSGMSEYSAPMLLIRGELLTNMANRTETECLQVLKQLEQILWDVPETANVVANQAKQMFMSLVGYGEYSELNTGDVEAFHHELETEPGHFYRKNEVDKALDTLTWMKKKTNEFVRDTHQLAREFLKLDEELARKIDLR
ncbi:DUF2974 domain-containing protein [Listeria sp. ILCC797]|uniref:DUF2974 domain-containing protein n=1 Tax=Listeria sp. ILCC797 TaxID=1918333 RepID=UPI000B59482B|nr:DUF2974 domain-containing protein [Listeria sp. ILCC797]